MTQDWVDPQVFLNLWSWEKIEAYCQFLIEKNERGGFFSKGDSERILDRHLFESMVYVSKILELTPVSRETEILDVGCGPGLPGMLFHCLLNPPKVFFLDSQSKRINLLQDFYNSHFDPGRSAFYVARAEEFHYSYPIVTSRAFLPFPFSAEVVCQLVKRDGYYVPFLGQPLPITDEIQVYLANLGFGSSSDISLPELGFLGMRHIKALKKSHSPKYGFPRQWKLISADLKGIQNGKNCID